MQTPTPRLALRKMNADGSDNVDVDNQYNVNFDILDESYIPRDANSGPRPDSSSGVFLYEENTGSSLYSVGSNEWNCFGSQSPLYEVQPDLTNVPNATNVFWPIGDAGQNNKCITRQAADTVRLNFPGIYLLTAMTRYASTTASGMFLLTVNYYNSVGGLIQVTQESDIKGAENAPVNLMIQTVHRVPSGFQDVRILTYQDTGGTRDIDDAEVDGSIYTRFQAVYARPIVQGV